MRLLLLGLEQQKRSLKDVQNKKRTKHSEERLDKSSKKQYEQYYIVKL